MDDDFTFGASVWASPAPEPSGSEPSSSKVQVEPVQSAFIPFTPVNHAASEPDPFDDDDFDAPAQVTAADDDDFGDFGDFGDGFGDAVDSTGFVQSSSFEDPIDLRDPQSASDWEALSLDPTPSTSELKQQVENILEPLWHVFDPPSDCLTKENIRQVGGLTQVLVTSESRALFNSLFQSSPPNTQPPNWTRSRTRRRHLVSLGIPVNLDEVLPHVNGKGLPALQITTRPMSAPPGPRRVASPAPINSRPGTPKPSPPGRPSSSAPLGLGPKPEIDENRINQMLALTQDSLTLLPLSTLEAHLASMRSMTADTSALLTYLLQQRDALQQDSETYNGLIAELVGEAQKMKAAPKSRTGSMRRTSGMP